MDLFQPEGMAAVNDEFDDDIVTPKSREEWAMLAALRIQSDHGDRGLQYIVQKFFDCSEAGDGEGIDTFSEIAKAYLQLLAAQLSPPN